MANAEANLASTILWRIYNIRSWNSDDHGVVVSTPNIVLNNLGENEWRLSFHPNVIGERDITLSLNRYVERVIIKCAWSVFDSDDVSILETVTHHQTTSEISCHYMLHTLKESGIFRDEEYLFMTHNPLTVRLRVWTPDMDFDQAEHVSVVTRILDKLLEDQFVWTIEGFSSLQLNKEVGATVYLRGHAFKLSFFLKGASLSDADVSFGVFTENAPRLDLVANVSICEKDGGVRECMEMEHKFSSSVRRQSWVVSKLVSRRELLERSSIWLHEDNLTLYCEFSCHFTNYVQSYIEGSYCGPGFLNTNIGIYSAGKQMKQCPQIIVSIISEENIETSVLPLDREDSSWQKIISKGSLLNNMECLFKNQILCDFEIRAKDGFFSVHKNILSVRSSFFKAMFCGDAKEANCKSLNDPELDKHTLGMFLTFLYSGIVTDLQWESAVKLCYAADKYQVSFLKDQCISFLESNITISNVSGILEEAGRLKDHDLTAFAIAFIENNFDDVILTDEWEKFLEGSSLAGKTMQEIYKKRKLIKTWIDL